MSEQTQKAADQKIFDSKPSDGLTAPTEDTLKSEPKLNTDSGTINRERQIKVYADRLESGELTVETIPENMKWVAPLAEQEIDRRRREGDVDALVEAKLAKLQQEQTRKAQQTKFAELKQKANSMDLEDSDKLMIEEAVQRFRSKGMSQADALEEALSTYEIVSKSGESAVTELKNRMNIPLKTKAVQDDEPEYGTEEFFAKGDSKSRIEKLEKIRQSTGMR